MGDKAKGKGSKLKAHGKMSSTDLSSKLHTVHKATADQCK